MNVKLKSYYADTVEAAMALAGKELGQDAMIVASRPAPAEACRPGEYEVMFAVPPATPMPERKTDAAPPWQKLTEELADLRKKLDALSPLRTYSRPPMLHSEMDEAMTKLLDAGLSLQVAQDLIESARLRLGRSGPNRDRERAAKMVQQELESRLAMDSSLGKTGEGARIAAFVGPPGAGKTSALVKLAARHALKARRPVHILSLDTYRIAAADQLRRYASILGIGCQVIDTPRGISLAIEENRGKELLLIDTPGLGPAETEIARDLKTAFAGHPEIDVHLVLPATMKSEDLSSAKARFQALGPAKLLFSQIDLATSLGSVLNEILLSELPVSFLSTGQQIPEDIEEASVERLLHAAFRTRLPAAVAAA
jgi:flagellar biosynthesis protein FlhF